MSIGATISVLLVLVILIAMGSLLSYLTRPAEHAKGDSDAMLIEKVNAVLTTNAVCTVWLPRLSPLCNRHNRTTRTYQSLPARW